MLQHAATRCNTLQRAATRCNALQHAATTLQHTATRRSTLQHTWVGYGALESLHSPCSVAKEPCKSTALLVQTPHKNRAFLKKVLLIEDSYT